MNKLAFWGLNVKLGSWVCVIHVPEPNYLWMYWPLNLQPSYPGPRPLVTTPRFSLSAGTCLRPIGFSQEISLYLFQIAGWIWHNCEEKSRPLSMQLVLILLLPSLLEYLWRRYLPCLRIWTSFQNLPNTETLLQNFSIYSNIRTKASLFRKNHLIYYFF